MLTLEIRSTIAPPDHMERALTSSGSKPTCGPDISTAFLRALVIYVIQMDNHLLFWCVAAGYMWPLAPCYQIYVTWRLIAATAHGMGCPVYPYPIDPLLNTFLLVKRRLKNSTEVQKKGTTMVDGVGSLLKQN